MTALENDTGAIRVGFAVGRRVGGAVARNRVRRRLREILRSLLNPASPTSPTTTAAPQTSHDPAFRHAGAGAGAGAASLLAASARGYDLVITAFDAAAGASFAALASELEHCIVASIRGRRGRARVSTSPPQAGTPRELHRDGESESP